MHKEFVGQTQFTFRLREAGEPLEPVCRLRFQVLCEETRLAKKERHPDGLIRDKYDPHALQFVAEDPHGVIAAVRLILNSAAGFPLEHHYFDHLDIDTYDLDHAKLGELSLMVISKQYRRRKGDGLYYTPESEFTPDAKTETAEGDAAAYRRIRPMVFGLYREVYQECRRRGITHFYTVMDSGLCMLLRLHSFIFHPIGPELDYFGPVAPYFANIQEIELKISQKMPKLMTYLLDGLEPIFHPQFSAQE